MELEHALAWRMRAHALDVRAPATAAVDVVARIAGLHAQVASSAELALANRVDGLEPGAAAAALWEHRTLVKLWATRGTLHLLPARELDLWLAAYGTYRHYRKPVWYRSFGVTEAELDAIIEAVGAALEGPPLTREELAAEVARRTGIDGVEAKLRDGFGSYLKPASFQGKLCFAPNEGRNVRFTRPDRWVEGLAAGRDPEAARRDVTRRYLAAYAPATREDLGRWWAVSPAEAGRMLRAIADELETVEVAGVQAWMPAGEAARAEAAEPPGVVRLLGAFDPLVVGATRSGVRTLPDDRMPLVFRPQGWLSPVICVDGVMVGTWRHERTGGRLELELSPWAPLAPWARAAAEAEAERVAAVLGGALALRWAGRRRAIAPSTQENAPRARTTSPDGFPRP